MTPEEGRYYLEASGMMARWTKTPEHSIPQVKIALGDYLTVGSGGFRSRQWNGVVERIKEISAGGDTVVNFVDHLPQVLRAIERERLDSTYTKALETHFGSDKQRATYKGKDMHICIHLRRDDLAFYQTPEGWVDVALENAEQRHRQPHPRHLGLYDPNAIETIADSLQRCRMRRHYYMRTRTELTVRMTARLVEELPKMYPDRQLSFSIISNGFLNTYPSLYEGLRINNVDRQVQEIRDLEKLGDVEVVIKGDERDYQRTLDILMGSSLILGGTSHSLSILGSLNGVPTIGLITEADPALEVLDVFNDDIYPDRIYHMLKWFDVL